MLSTQSGWINGFSRRLRSLSKRLFAQMRTELRWRVLCRILRILYREGWSRKHIHITPKQVSLSVKCDSGDFLGYSLYLDNESAEMSEQLYRERWSIKKRDKLPVVKMQKKFLIGIARTSDENAVSTFNLHQNPPENSIAHLLNCNRCY